MPLARTAIIVFLSVGVAFLSGAAAVGMVLEKSNPQLALRLPLTDGFVRSEMAKDAMARSIREGTLLQLDWSGAEARRVREQAVQAYRQEPFDASALAVMALADESGGHKERARKLMRDADRLTRRGLIVNVWRMNDFSRSNDLAKSMEALDNALRTSSAGRSLLVRSLVQSLAHDDLVEIIADLLQDNPPWSQEFWNQSYRNNGALANAARLRVIAANRHLPVDDASTRALIKQLTNARLFDEAQQVVAAASVGTFPKDQIVRNSDFRKSPGLLPFDWELFFDDSLSSDIIPNAGVLRVTTYSDGSGPVARQLVSLSGNAYTLTAKVRDWDATDRDALYFRLTCAERGNEESTPQLPLSQRNTVIGFHKPDSDCTHYWLGIFASPQSQQQSNQVLLDEVSLRQTAPGA